MPLAEDFQSARLDRMTEEELLAQVVMEAVKVGFDPEVARMKRTAAVRWYEERVAHDGLAAA